jgi:hypothetical protein
MYRLFTHSGTLGAWKALYCTAEFARCARYGLSVKGQPVPINLMPNGQLLRKTK